METSRSVDLPGAFISVSTSKGCCYTGTRALDMHVGPGGVPFPVKLEVIGERRGI